MSLELPDSLEQPDPIDFEKLMQNMKDARQLFGETAHRMKGAQRENFDGLLSMIDDKMAAFKDQLPKTQQVYREKFEELQKQHDENLAKSEELKAKTAEIKSQMIDGKMPALKPNADTPVDPELGKTLRRELLDRFAKKTSINESQAGLAWQDWNLDGSWVSDES